MKRPSSDVAFTPSVKAVQQARGSRPTYERIERERGGFRTRVDDDLRAFLADIDTAYLATASAGGQPYVQHRGGPAGFIRALDDETIGFVDLAGNRQYISTGNLAENDRVCLFLMDYEQKRRVKVWGTARIVALTTGAADTTGVVPLTAGATDTTGIDARADAWLRALDVGDEGRAEQLVIIHVDAWDVNCSQHIPQKVNALDVVEVVRRLEGRIAELEAQLRERGRT